MPPDEYARYREDEATEDKATFSLPPTVVQADKSKWSLYMHPKDETEVNHYNCRNEYCFRPTHNHILQLILYMFGLGR